MKLYFIKNISHLSYFPDIENFVLTGKYCTEIENIIT